MIVLALLPIFAAVYLVGYLRGKRATDRKWLTAMLEQEPLGFDEMLVRLLEEIEDEH